jgi:hypothetical protein
LADHNAEKRNSPTPSVPDIPGNFLSSEIMIAFRGQSFGVDICLDIANINIMDRMQKIAARECGIGFVGAKRLDVQGHYLENRLLQGGRNE